MHKFLFFCLLILATGVAVSAQPDAHDHEPLANFDLAPAQYAVQVKVDDARSRLVAWMDLTCANQSDTIVHQMLFRIPEHGRFHLDSILLFGAPLEADRIRVRDNWMELNLIIRPGEQVPLQFSFSTDVPGLDKMKSFGRGLLIDDWYPIVMSDCNELQSIPQLADFRIEIITDSAYFVAAPGTWVNEIEHLGSIPERADTILVDLRSPIQSHAEHHVFAFRLTGAEQFSFALLRHGRLTRIQFNQQRIDLIGAVDFSRKDQLQFAKVVAEASRAIVDKLGALPDGRFCAFFGDIESPGLSTDRLARVSRGLRNPELMLVELTTQLTAQYFNRADAPFTDLPWSEGASIFAAIDVLYNLDPDKGYQMAERWLDFKLPPRDIRSPLSNRPFAWMDNLQRPNRPFSQADSLKFLQLFQAPSALQIVAAGSSTEAVLALLRRYSLDVRHRHARPDELPQLIMKELGGQWENWLHECVVDHGAFDWSIGTVTIEPSGDAFDTRVVTTAQRLADLPVDLVLTNGYDTLISRYTPLGPNGQRVPFLVQTAFRPTSVFLDLYHRLPDHNRQNNVWISGRTGGRYKEDRREYPTYRRMTLGD